MRGGQFGGVKVVDIDVVLRAPLNASHEVTVRYCDDRFLAHDIHCKTYPYIHGYFVASFPYFDGTSFVRIKCMCARASLFRRFAVTNVYGTVSFKYRILANRHSRPIHVYGNFFTVQTTNGLVSSML